MSHYVPLLGWTPYPAASEHQSTLGQCASKRTAANRSHRACAHSLALSCAHGFWGRSLDRWVLRFRTAEFFGQCVFTIASCFSCSDSEHHCNVTSDAIQPVVYGVQQTRFEHLSLFGGSRCEHCPECSVDPSFWHLGRSSRDRRQHSYVWCNDSHHCSSCFERKIVAY